jgi:uncharacterized protein (TIGR00299 family) protein
MKIAYLDCFSGTSGDMFLGALIDLGLPRTLLVRELKSLPLGHYTLHIAPAQRMHLTGYRVVVKVPHLHHHRNLEEITRLIEKSHFNQRVKELSIKVFQRLAHAEAKVHHTKVSEVHFHEVGAVDSIIDIVGTIFGVDYLHLGEIHASAVPLGSGFSTCEHGIIPLPAPATMELLKGVPAYGTSHTRELVTPTGAALLTTLSTHYGPFPPMKIHATGYGAGSAHLEDRPNLLRIIVGERVERQEADQVAVLETNIDDMIPEIYDYLMEQLFKRGALDVSFSPLQMKKNRPGVLVSVICAPEKIQELSSLILKESTSGGIRYYYAHRIKLPREIREITTPLGRLKVKVFKDIDGSYFASPEYEACKEIAVKRGIPLKNVYQEVTKVITPLSSQLRQKKKRHQR